MDIIEKFRIIKDHYELEDSKRMKEGKTPYHTTDYGIWGPSGMLDLFEFFMKIKLERFESFADYGSGDGRVAMIASLFTKATGIEGDIALFKESEKAKKAIGDKVPEVLKVNIKNSNYYNEDHEKYDIIFVFMDHEYPRSFERSLKNKFSGWLISYNKIFLPRTLKKGKTYWIQQIPIITYPINVDEEIIF